MRAYPADEAGHILHFVWVDDLRRAQCKGCIWDIPAPGTGYARARVEHSRFHQELMTNG